MSFFFSMSESIRSMTKARMATMISITSIALTLILIGAFILASINLHRWITVVRAKIEMEVFLETGIAQPKIDRIKKYISNSGGVKAITFISSEQAAKRFEEEFGENVYEILAFNPFPPSFIITLEETHQTPQKIEKIKTDLEALPEVDEVIYQKPLIDLIDHYLNLLYLVLLVICIVVVVIAVILINNTIRLTIYARRDIIQIMRLIGATEGFIRRPFIFEGIFQGLLGSIIAALILYYLSRIVQIFFYPEIVYTYHSFLGLIIFGVLIGLFSAFFSVGKYIHRV